MAFPTLFGLSKLLQQCGVTTQGVRLANKEEITLLPCPFIAYTPEGFVIVTDVGNESVGYLTQGVVERIELSEFLEAWDGTALLARAEPAACEPDFCEHHIVAVADVAKRWLLRILAVGLFAYLFISNGLWRHWSTILITLFDIGGLWLTTMLVQKSLHISNAAADRVCGVLQAGGCDNILEMKASKCFGIFGWSEVGFAYFSVSLLTLLIFPQYIHYLAACLVCCLPFTLWSIWYQKFRAKVWCTLCVCVQCTLWLLFFCYLGGGWLRDIFPLRIEFFVLGATYLFVLLALNRLMPKLENNNDDD